MDFYLNQVLTAFSKMDIDSLGELMDESRTYSDVPLESFLRSLNTSFKQFRDAGDEELELLPGYCHEMSCNPDQIRTGYRLLGKQSKSYLDLRFVLELTNDRKDHEIADIYSCSCFSCHHEEFGLGARVNLRIHADEHLRFLGKSDLQIYAHKANVELKLLKKEPNPLTYDWVEAWLILTQATFDYLAEATEELPYFEDYSWEEFLQTRAQLNKYWNVVRELYEEGLLTWDFSKKINEEELIEKVIQAETIMDEYFCEFLFQNTNLDEDFFINWRGHSFREGYFDLFPIFWKGFIPIRAQLVQKYYALSEYETEDFLEDEYCFNQEETLESLYFHMNIRKEAKERGEEIPFYSKV
ncbi:hypothetical protein SAMN04488519_104207 [Algoriphagus ornithinivorans]|uniref:Uncharacterized protein n=1 Tax=Algoriphagus ornithinivorans TaxID=226506 RepID=A0A1I5F4E6_9BACT|nr:hypothetical protein [Algoriphagus ornithinivorans]SFO18550.1 hypothetical protein SAMN04488519_104207 [Algoriphagus ornithinivorans]